MLAGPRPAAAAGRVNHGTASNLGDLQGKLGAYAAQTVEEDEADMEHAIKAALAEHDRIALTEMEALQLSFRRRRNEIMSKLKPCPQAPLPPSGIGQHEVENDRHDLLDEAEHNERVSAARAKPLLNASGRRELERVEERVRREVESAVERERARLAGAKALAMQQLEREHRVEQDLLSKDVHQHIERLRRDATTDCGFTRETLLLWHMRFADAERTEQLRFDFARERERTLARELPALQREQVPRRPPPRPRADSTSLSLHCAHRNGEAR
jgi:hypothetical protein